MTIRVMLGISSSLIYSVVSVSVSSLPSVWPILQASSNRISPHIIFDRFKLDYNNGTYNVIDQAKSRGNATNGNNFTQLSRIPILEFCNFRVKFLVHAFTLIVCMQE